jgi:hypothetical protein
LDKIMGPGSYSCQDCLIKIGLGHLDAKSFFVNY